MTELASKSRIAAAPQAHAPAVGLSGAGRQRAAIEALLSPRYRIVAVDDANLTDSAERCGVVLAVSDGWETDYGGIAKACGETETPWLPVRVELGQAVIGPLVRPGQPGCASCAESRRRAARMDGTLRQPLHERYGRQLAEKASTWLTGLAVDTVAALVAGEVGALLDRDAATDPAAVARTRAALVCVALDTLATSVHPFLPNPLCSECGTVPDDSAEAAALTLRSRPKPAPGEYRVRHLDDIARALRGTYVDAEAGVVSAVRPLEAWGMAVAEAPVAMRDSGITEHGIGRTLDHRSSGVCAILEALERYGGVAPGRTRPAVWASYADVRDRALDPRALGLYPPQRHEQPRFPYQQFDEGLELQWVWAYSFGRRRPVLVPATFAYYGYSLSWMRGRPLAYETSNGCALGSCLEEAILYGILEVAERDAFLMTWYARLPVPRIALDSARDRRIPLLAERVERASGYEVMAFATTVEQGVPAVLVMAVNRRPEPGRAQALCAAGAHLDPERACAGALAELIPMLATTQTDYSRQADRVRSMVDDPDQVRVMADHALLYCDPATFDRMGFLFASGEQRTFADAFTGPEIRNGDMRDDLTQLIDRYTATGLDVIVVDQTTAEHRAGGLSCVKVIIPGTLPMTFGHHARRTDGLPRLLTVPHLLGYRDRPLRPAEINPHPHPFP